MIGVNTNLNSLRMQSNLNTATNAVNVALERMSTGYKINSAKDNAAGMFISSKLNAQIRGLKVAQTNVATGFNVLQTAEGALNNANDILLRLRDLSVQSANSYYDYKSREAMQSEANELIKQLKQIYDGTSFNGLDLFKSFDAADLGIAPKVASLAALRPSGGGG